MTATTAHRRSATTQKIRPCPTKARIKSNYILYMRKECDIQKKKKVYLTLSLNKIVSTFWRNDLASFAIHVVVYFKQRTRRQGQCTFRGKKTHLSCYVFPALIFDDMEM